MAEQSFCKFLKLMLTTPAQNWRELPQNIKHCLIMFATTGLDSRISKLLATKLISSSILLLIQWATGPGLIILRMCLTTSPKTPPGRKCRPKLKPFSAWEQRKFHKETQYSSISMKKHRQTTLQSWITSIQCQKLHPSNSSAKFICPMMSLLKSSIWNKIPYSLSLILIKQATLKNYSIPTSKPSLKLRCSWEKKPSRKC